MRIIEKIEIKYFRSFDGGVKQPKAEIYDLKDLNIFSGANDSGKSNILRALNLFFNNEISPGIPFDLERDLSKVQKNRSDQNTIKKKEKNTGKNVRQRDLWVKIRIYFNNDKAGVLPEKFYVEKMWDKNGLSQYKKNDIKKNPDPKKVPAQSGQLSMFLNNISFEYIPAVKDKEFFNILFKKLQNYLFKKQSPKDNQFAEYSNKVNDLLKIETKNLFEDFKRNTGINAGFTIPDTLVDFFRTLGVETGNGISLFDRGDGIQARFIPDILNEISRGSKKKVIWGFEEPENSYEPLKCFELAQDFVNYSINKQIFITSHAFPFIGLKGENISSYRVKNKGNTSLVGIIDWNQRTIKGLGIDNNADELEKEVGILEMYTRLSNHLGEVSEKRKNYVFVEDTKKQIYKISWLKINNIECTVENYEELFNQKCPFYLFDKGGRNDLQKFLDIPTMDEYKNSKIIGIFDFDDGFSNFNGLSKERWEIISGNKENCLFRKRKQLNYFYSIMIPVPTSRTEYADPNYQHNYLTLEHLFEDNILDSIGCNGGFSIPSGGIKIRKIKGKNNLWKKIINLPNYDFENFKPLFEKINILFNL